MMIIACHILTLTDQQYKNQVFSLLTTNIGADSPVRLDRFGPSYDSG